jgi:hypothetical protein
MFGAAISLGHGNCYSVQWSSYFLIHTVTASNIAKMVMSVSYGGAKYGHTAISNGPVEQILSENNPIWIKALLE